MSEENRYLTVALVCMAALIYLLYTIDFAHGQSPGHTHEGAAGAFYQKWMMPDNRAVSCCHDEDCAASQSKFEGGAWWARWKDDDDWVRIPDNKVERERDTPDGRSHMCGRKYFFSGGNGGFTVFCFLPGSSG